MFTYIVVYIFLLVFIYVDYTLYKARIKKMLAEQADYDSNKENYDCLAEKFYIHQKKISTYSAGILGLIVLLFIVAAETGILQQ